MARPLYLVIMLTDNKYYLLCVKEGSIAAFPTRKMALNYFESAYHKAHTQSYEQSMSACIHFVVFQSSVVKLKSQEELLDYFDGKKEATFVSVSHVSGGFIGAEINQEVGKIMFERGDKPTLI